ncbi:MULTISPECIES: SMP-30/gluconolactonase/LRE family protein [unclassified Mesorhizobium]|uniref:SMP-30/gluconolactonase/LRE family protein n=1 Tax=unclassified Mesorhizobium TaxID=325217 RepID=UPI000FCBFDCC|nr:MULTISPECIES: SMP-30/gluconolactonase/LRE family protein [unclassified Mesorhizobium]RUV98151.1 SMP-30/gluconolactonase/LRE family protein [Mesorhizobium sp. M1A.F.Ca.IN.020.04.1.1]RUW02582.1 SMP-30/gluconolactonase/LRE family protein [Mesorhizobium sp. M1A.F.Ca.IN.020.03.1.1]RWF69256.1 MAG: SMP-30/gluconolactonase/LRE family protein [Mesorhizobium sp.]RWG14709.1 MAG: SMP-30/gluconolactonase/LRE family protein [Mesorhizobium sp.]RWH09651.1 MAG: SMP-30/gluconolactonase/LRE family protein [Me
MFGDIEGAGFEVLNERFERCFVGHVAVERLWTGGRWLEGPAWFAAGRYLLFSDIPNDRIMRYDDTSGTVSVFRSPSNNANGNTVDFQGRLVTCEHRARRVDRTEHDGSISVIADRFEGRRLNSPNDVVVRSDGTVWFSDPPYGIATDYEGDRAEQEIEGCHVYRADPATGEVTRVVSTMAKPNGLAFSPDETILYVGDTGVTHQKDGPRHIRKFAVEGNNLRELGVFTTCTAGLFDGFRVDTTGRVWAGAGDGVHCFDPDGTLIGKIRIPETVANLTFGGPKRNRLFITARQSLYAAFVVANAAGRG